MPKAREWGEQERGTIRPLVRGGLGGPPPKKIEFLALLCAFLTGVLCF